jgi:hypothetical protein
LQEYWRMPTYLGERQCIADRGSHNPPQGLLGTLREGPACRRFDRDRRRGAPTNTSPAASRMWACRRPSAGSLWTCPASGRGPAPLWRRGAGHSGTPRGADPSDPSDSVSTEGHSSGSGRPLPCGREPPGPRRGTTSLRRRSHSLRPRHSALGAGPLPSGPGARSATARSHPDLRVGPPPARPGPLPPPQARGSPRGAAPSSPGSHPSTPGTRISVRSRSPPAPGATPSARHSALRAEPLPSSPGSHPLRPALGSPCGSGADGRLGREGCRSGPRSSPGPRLTPEHGGRPTAGAGPRPGLANPGGSATAGRRATGRPTVQWMRPPLAAERRPPLRP